MKNTAIPRPRLAREVQEKLDDGILVTLEDANANNGKGNEKYWDQFNLSTEEFNKKYSKSYRRSLGLE